jgi:hypothetical protein
VLVGAGYANATTLGKASVALSDPTPSQTGVNYTFTVGATGSVVSSTAIKCVEIVYSQLASDTTGATPPAGFSDATASTAGLASSTLVNSSASGWSVAVSGSGNNVLKYTNSTGVVPGTTTGATFVDNLVTNSNTANVAYYAFFNTFSDTGCSTPIDTATVQFINTQGSTLSLTVSDTLAFTVNSVSSGVACDSDTNPATTTAASTATTIPFGTVTAAANALVCQNLTAATNATNGYTIYARYTAPPTNALAQTIADWSGTNATPTVWSGVGTEGYGYTTNDAALGTGTVNRFTNGGPKFAAMTTSNLEVGYEPNGVTSTTFEIGHQVGVSLTTHPGTYTTTIIYTCTPIY